MILEQATYKWFGYYPKNLKSESNKKIITSCNECGNIKITTKNAYCVLCKSCANKGNKNSLGKHNSEETKQKMRKAKKERICKPFTKEHKQNMSNSRKLRKFQPMSGKHHSESTKEKMSKMRKGELHPNWKGGISGKSYEECFDMTMIEWKELAKQIRERDIYICQYCGKKQSIEVHHIIPRNIKIDNHPSNLITLCKSCHIKIEHLTTKYIEQSHNPIEIFYEKWNKQ